MLHNGPPHPSNEAYAYAKRMVDVLTRMYVRDYGVNFTSVVLTNVFGKYDNFHLEKSHVVPGLVHKCYIAQQKNEPLHVLGSGKPLRQFIYSKDLGHLLLWVLQDYASSEPLILSVDESDEMSIGDVARVIADAMDFKGDIVFDTSGPEGQYKKTACNDKMRKALPDFKFTPLKTAMKETVDWFVANYDSVRK